MDEGKGLCTGNNAADSEGSRAARPVDDHKACAKRCYDTADCAAWMFHTENGNCWLKTTADCIQNSAKCMWGTKQCAGKHKIQECLQYFLDSKYFRIITIFFLVCEPGWTLFEPTGKCYRKYSNGKNWTEARSACQEEEENGDLASIPNQATNDFMLSLFQNHNAKKWIGGYDYDEDGVWKWTDGTPWQFRNWDTDQPSNEGDKDHLAINLKSAKWLDMKITAKLHFICQYKP